MGTEKITPQFEFAEVMKRMRALRAQIAPNDSQERFESLGVDVFRGDARLRSAHEVEIGDTVLRAKNIVIATGSHATIPKIAGIESVPYFTNETIFDQLENETCGKHYRDRLSDRAWSRARETFARLGVRVTILQRGPQLLPREDPEVAEFLEKCLRDKGVKIVKNAETKAVSQSSRGIELQLLSSEQSTITADVLLISAGRTPRVGEIGLEKIGVASSARGVQVNEYLQTTQPHIYAAGDVAGPFLFTHMADTQARVVVRKAGHAVSISAAENRLFRRAVVHIHRSGNCHGRYERVHRDETEHRL